MNTFTYAGRTGIGYTLRFLSVLSSLAIVLGACESSSVTPTSPTRSVTAIFTLSGAVIEMTASGPTPIEGAKAGYEYPTGTVSDSAGRIAARVDGDTRFDVELVRR